MSGAGHAGVLVVDIHVPASASLKDKRAVLQHLLGTSRQRFRVAASEVGGQDLRQRGTLAFACVGASSTQVGEVLDALERFVWSHPEVVVLSARTEWLDLGG